MDTNCIVVDEAEKAGVRSYIFTPCIVYGKGEGFGNPVSIQTVAIVQAAYSLKRVYKVDEGTPVSQLFPGHECRSCGFMNTDSASPQTWPVCHVSDNTTLYLELLRKILDGQDPGHGKNGYYLASSGSVAWDDIYEAMAASLEKRHVVADSAVVSATPQIVEQMGQALQCPPAFVPVQIGGR